MDLGVILVDGGFQRGFRLPSLICLLIAISLVEVRKPERHSCSYIGLDGLLTEGTLSLARSRLSTGLQPGWRPSWRESSAKRMPTPG